VVIGGTLWLVRGGFKSGYPLYTRFTWGQNLKQGQQVLLAGVDVGYVGKVELANDGYLEVTIRINGSRKIPRGTNATVKPVGIFGDVAVALTPPPPPLRDIYYASGDTIPPGPPATDIGEIMSRVDSIGESVSVLAKALRVEVIEAGTLKDIHKTMASAAALSVQLQGVVAEQSRNVTQTLNAFRDAAARFGGVVDSTQIAATVANIRQTTENATRLSADLDSTNTALKLTLDKIRNGNGTLGKLLNDSTAYNDAHHLMARMDSLLTDFQNNPKKYINLRIF
jgi:phospholipid/cholesterol/gamma-HCH transport system substrate-binding protein